MSSFGKDIGSFQVSHEYTQLQVVKARVTEKEKVVNGQLVKTKIFKEVAKAKTDTLTVRLTTSDLGQQLTFCFQRGGNEEDAKDPTSRVLATFTMKKNFELTMVCNQEFNAINSYTYKPLLTAFPGIEAGSVSDVFSQWLCTDEFVEHLKIVSAKKGYTPALVKMLFLFIAYQQERYSKFVELGEYSKTMEIDLDRVVAIFKEYISGFSEDFSVHLKKHYNVSQFTLSAAATPAIESIQVTPSTPDV
ncbi:hypothetical protein QUA71_05400 [Microcoleus sp. MON1_C5]|uniref:hypothetical protein n=1 Tax=Microcoleus sp. MON1_C5 TaxID=2818828 RepID=UPI002FD73914